VTPIDHLDLVVTSLHGSLAFYRGLLEPLGYVRVSEIQGERGERVVYLGRIGGMGSVSLREAQSHAHGVPYDRYGVGLHHLAFNARSRSSVDERAAWSRAVATGGFPRCPRRRVVAVADVPPAAVGDAGHSGRAS
jgi:hypothetical protein